MSKKDSNILEIKLERLIKRSYESDFNKGVKPIPNHPASVSQLWSLPSDFETLDYQFSQSFGKMYVGESFTSSLKVSNISQAVLEKVSIVCTLKYTNNKNSPVLFQTEINRLFPEITNKFAFTLNVDVPDIYYLNLQANFTVKELAEPISVGKLFKFEAKVPFEFRNTVVKADEGFLLQTRMINQSIYPITIDLVEFVCGNAFKSISYTAINDDIPFSPGEIRSFLYHLIEIMPMPANNDLGRAVVTWHNNTGDIGYISSPGISHSYKYEKTLKISIENKPKYFLLEEPTTISLRFSNLTLNITIEDVKIEISDESMVNSIITPLSPSFFNKIKPQETVSLLCAIFPKVPGIHKIEGIRVFAGKKLLDYETSTICIKPI